MLSASETSRGSENAVKYGLTKKQPIIALFKDSSAKPQNDRISVSSWRRTIIITR